LVGPGNGQLFNLNSDDEFGRLHNLHARNLSVCSSLAIATYRPDYSFRLLDAAVATNFTIGDTVSGNVGASGREVINYKFTGTAGQNIFVDGIGSNNDNVRLAIFDSAGRQIYENNADNDSAPFALPRTGEYRVTIRGFSMANAPYAFGWRI